MQTQPLAFPQHLLIKLNHLTLPIATLYNTINALKRSPYNIRGTRCQAPIQHVLHIWHRLNSQLRKGVAVSPV